MMISALPSLAETPALSQMSLGIIVLVIGAACACFAMLRGAFRLLLSTTLLAASLFVAYYVWLETPGLGDKILRNPPAWFPFLLPTIAGIACFIFLRKALRLVLKPFGTIGGTPSSFFGKITSLSLSLIPTTLLCLTGATAIRHVGTLEEIKNPAGNATSTLLKKTIDQYVPPAWLQRIDPLTDPSRITLAQLLAMAQEEHIPRAIPVAEEHLIRSSVLDDPKLQQLTKDQRFSEILRDPAIESALQDPRIRKAIEEFQKQSR
jgi:hypothetical protein